MIVVPMDDQSVILGQEFPRLVRAAPVPHEDCFLFEDGTKMFGVLMMVRKTFGRVPCISYLNMLKVTGGDRPKTITHPQKE